MLEAELHMPEVRALTPVLFKFWIYLRDLQIRNADKYQDEEPVIPPKLHLPKESKAELSRVTGLTARAVTTSINDLADQGFFVGYSPPTERGEGAAKPAAPSPSHKDCITYFTTEYERKFKTKYTFNGGMDGKAMQILLKNYSEDTVKKMIDLYLADQDPFLVRTGRTIHMLRTRANQYAVKAVRPVALVYKSTWD